MWGKRARVRALSLILSLVLLAVSLSSSPAALAARPDDLEAEREERLRYELWYERMDDIAEIFLDWSRQNGIDDGKGYCTKDGAPFAPSEGPDCYIGNVTSAMRGAGLIDYTVTGGWSCNGFARFALRTLYGRTFWRDQMTENVYPLSLFSTVASVRDFMQSSGARIGDMIMILGHVDLDGNGTLDEYLHYMIYIREQDDGVLVLDGNFDHDNSVRIHMVSWEFLMSRHEIYLYHVSDRDYLSVEQDLAGRRVRETASADPDWSLLAK